RLGLDGGARGQEAAGDRVAVVLGGEMKRRLPISVRRVHEVRRHRELTIDGVVVAVLHGGKEPARRRQRHGRAPRGYRVTAINSTPIQNSGRASRTTWTSVLAGAVSPK